MLDGLAVVGGGLSGAASLFLPALIDEVNGNYTGPSGPVFRRLVPHAFDLEDSKQLNTFLQGHVRKVVVPGSQREVEYNSLARLGIGLSVLGTSRAVAIGAYAFALHVLDR